MSSILSQQNRHIDKQLVANTTTPLEEEKSMKKDLEIAKYNIYKSTDFEKKKKNKKISERQKHLLSTKVEKRKLYNDIIEDDFDKFFPNERKYQKRTSGCKSKATSLRYMNSKELSNIAITNQQEYKTFRRSLNRLPADQKRNLVNSTQESIKERSVTPENFWDLEPLK